MLKFRNLKSALLAGVAVAVISIGSQAQAQGQPHEFSVPAGDAAQAIETFKAQAGVTISAPQDLAGLRTSAVNGSMDVDTALSTLLAGSGLQIIDLANGVYTLGRETADTVSAIVVSTGSSIRGVKPAGAETITLNRSDILASGVSSASQLLNTVPQFQNNLGSGASETPGATSRVGQANQFTQQSNGSGVDLRGLGNGATLVLVDGRRVAASGVQTFTDANQVPLAALERVEIVADSASAIYGSDAVAGVVNYVIRKNYNGLELSTNAVDQLGAVQHAYSATGGKSWDWNGGGNALASFTYDYRQATPSTASPYLLADLTPLGGNNTLLFSNTLVPVNAPLSTQPYISIPYCPAGLTYNAAGGGQCRNSSGVAVANTILAHNYVITPTDAGLYQAGNMANFGAAVRNSPTPTYVDNANYTDYLSRRIRNSATLYLRQAITDRISATYQGVYDLREDRQRSGYSRVLRNIDAPVGATQSRSYIPELAPAAGGRYQVSVPLGASVRRNHNTTLTHTFSVEAKLWGDWTGDISSTLSTNRDKGQIQTSPQARATNADAITAAVNATNGFSGFRFNIYDNERPTDAEQGNFVGSNINPVVHTFNETTLKFQGTVTSLPAGALKAAVGVSTSRETDNHFFKTSIFGVPAMVVHAENAGRDSRSINAAFAELSIPVFSSENAMPFFQSLNVSVAGRTEKYSDVGANGTTTSNPKIGVSWAPLTGVTLRGTYGTAFRAPGLTEKSSGPTDIFYHSQIPTTNNVTATGHPDLFALGRAPVNIQILGRANNQLKPETATNTSYGVDWTPEWLQNNLRLSATYYKIDYKDKIQNVSVNDFLKSDANATAFKDYITLIHQNPACNPTDPTTYPKELLDKIPFETAVYNSTNPFVYQNICAATVLLDARMQNIAGQMQSGLDLTGNYRVNNKLGNWNFGLNLTHVLKMEVRPIQGLPPTTNVLGYIGGPVKYRARATAAWHRNGYGVDLSVNYIGSYIDDLQPTIRNVTLPVLKVPAWTTVGLQLSYATGDEVPTWARGIRTSLNFQNLFDKPPPYAPAGNSIYDASNANIFGRITTIQLTKAFN